MPLNLVCILFVLYSGSCLAQTKESDGLYIIINNTKDCSNLKTVLNSSKTKYCLSQRPIISASEFVSISEIREDTVAAIQTITLKLSQNGYNTWKGVIKNFPDSKMALVVAGFVTGTFVNKGEIALSTIPISGRTNAPEIVWIYNHLKGSTDSNKKE